VGTAVNKYQIRLGSGDNFIKFPLLSTTSGMGQEDVVNNDFVEKEVEKAINPIIDHDKKRFSPRVGDDDVFRVNYKVNILNNAVFPEKTTYATEGFENDDIIYQRNNFRYSFLNLLFFDNDEPTKQNYLGNIPLYSRLSRFDLKGDKNLAAGNSASDTSGSGSNTGKDVIEATYDEGIADANLMGHVCTSIYFPQKIEYYYEGTKWKRKTITSWGESIEGCEVANSMLGEEVTQRPSKLPVTGLFSTVRLLDSEHIIPGNRGTYGVYAIWTRNIYLNQYYLEKVYFIRNEREATVVTDYTTGENRGGRDIISGDGSGEVIDSRERTDRLVSREYREYDITGVPSDVSEIPIRFIVEDPVAYPLGRAEGFYLYQFNEELPTSIFMRANWNNAKTGLSTDLVTTKDVLDIDEVLGKLHMKYDLKKSGDTYYYEIDSDYSDNVEYSLNEMSINLYEIQVR
jgi:hypothetical protein